MTKVLRTSAKILCNTVNAKLKQLKPKQKFTWDKESLKALAAFEAEMEKFLKTDEVFDESWSEDIITAFMRCLDSVTFTQVLLRGMKK